MMKPFTDHPQSVGETYLEHMGTSFYFSIRMFLASIALVFHAFFPFLFVKTGGNTVRSLHKKMVTHRDKRDSMPEPS